MLKYTRLVALFLIMLSLEACGNSQLQKTKADVDQAALDKGNQYFHQYRCVQCHGENGKTGFADLTKVAEKYSLDQVKTWISNPRSVKPNTSMPSFNMLNDEQLTDLAKYVMHLGEK